MASKEHKIVRRAEAMSELTRLSGLLAEHLKVEVPDVNATGRDSELAEIQRIENINGLLAQVLEANKVEVEAEAEVEAETETKPESEPVKKSSKKHGTVK